MLCGVVVDLASSRSSLRIASFALTMLASSFAWAQAPQGGIYASGPVRFSAPTQVFPPPAQRTALYWQEKPRGLIPAFLAPERRVLAPAAPSLAPKSLAPKFPTQRASAPAAREDLAPRRGRQALALQARGRLTATATNYCVRLCDGYAFPVGDASRNAGGAQEMACRSACPGAPTALFTAPAGARDFDAMTRAGLPYSSLPMAFRYRKETIEACTCKAAGATQPVSALYTDLTLRRGDLAMTSRGMLHFDGAARLPYRRAQFSDALARLTDKRDIAMVRGMEAASLRDGMSAGTTSAVRARVITEIRRSELRAAAETKAGAGFVELSGTAARVVTLPVVRRPAGLVALN